MTATNKTTLLNISSNDVTLSSNPCWICIFDVRCKVEADLCLSCHSRMEI